jgi:hypothetical protein
MREHYSEGTVYSSGGIISGYTPGTGSDAGNTYGLSAAFIFDEDLYPNLSALTDVNGASAIYQMLYRTAASAWAWSLSDMPFYYTGTTGAYSYLNYDLNGTLTPAGSGKYLNYYLIMTNAVATSEATQGISTSPFRFCLIPGRATFSSAALAYAERFADFGLSGFVFDEGVTVWQITYRTNESASVKGRCNTISHQRVYSNIVTTTQSVVPAAINPAFFAEQVAAITTGTQDLKLSTVTKIATALTNANTFTVALPTPISGYASESILIFKTGASVPTITWPTVAKWLRPVPTLVINTTYTIWFHQVTFDGTTYETHASWG